MGIGVRVGVVGRGVGDDGYVVAGVVGGAVGDNGYVVRGVVGSVGECG